MNDREIVNLYWQRSEQAISETERKYGSYCHIIAYNILENSEDSEECVNDTWMSAWNAMPDKRPDRLSPFLARITRNFALTKIFRGKFVVSKFVCFCYDFFLHFIRNTRTVVKCFPNGNTGGPKGVCNILHRYFRHKKLLSFLVSFLSYHKYRA